jgi:putative FmdB family regulatory protein
MFPAPGEEATMPVYEYRCGKCGHEFEEIQRITADPIRKCPKCGKLSVERLISRTSFVLKGSGWYVTDYARKSASAPAPAGDGGTKDGDSGAKTETPKTDTKTDAKTDAKPKTEAKTAAADHATA